MKVNELMIGDWVRIKDKVEPDAYFMHDDMRPGQNVEVEEILSNGINPNWCYGEVSDYLPEDAIEPIPLTPEILEKNGFRKRPHRDNSWVNDESDARYVCFSIGEALNLWGGCDQDYVWVTVQYVHQLQHAFRIFGIEKEIKL